MTGLNPQSNNILGWTVYTYIHLVKKHKSNHKKTCGMYLVLVLNGQILTLSVDGPPLLLEHS